MCRSAVTQYTSALKELAPVRDTKLLANRSAAYAKLGRFDEALKDADESAALTPAWDKAHGRRGVALAGLGRHTDVRTRDAIAWRASPASAAPRTPAAALAHPLRSLTRCARSPAALAHPLRSLTRCARLLRTLSAHTTLAPSCVACARVSLSGGERL
jgi:tetratricopeptide (TPR) repeat protein